MEEGSTFFIAEQNDTAIGYLKFRTLKKPDGLTAKKTIQIERIYVLKEFISLKVGAALMEKPLAYSSENGYDTIWFDVWERNIRAINFYEKWGL
jgi:ribosomal protein S18 acetylase RimI-like enzyme